MSISDKDSIDIALGGLHSYLKEKLEGFNYYNLNDLQLRAMNQEYKFRRAKEDCESHQSSTHDDSESNGSDDERKEVYVAEFVWPSEAMPCSCPSLKPNTKNRREEARFTFDVSKCDRIFDELLRSGNIKLSHVIPPLEELKRHAYCKWHNSFSHATNDYNVFHRHVQSAVNEG